MPAHPERFNTKALILLAIIAVGALAAVGWAGSDLWHPRLLHARLASLVESLGPWAPAGYVGLYALSPFVLLPSIPLTIAGGALFGAIEGAFFALLGAACGATLSFFAGRVLGHDALTRHAHGRLLSVKAGIEEEGWRFVAFLRLVPVLPFGIANVLLGATDVRFSTFFLTTIVAMAPGVAILAWAGHEGREAMAGAGNALGIVGVAVGLVLLVSGIPAAIRYARRMRAADHSE